jgi:hypothetical protein
MELFNQAMLGKQCWRILTAPYQIHFVPEYSEGAIFQTVHFGMRPGLEALPSHGAALCMVRKF